MAQAKYGYTECHVCGSLVPVHPLTREQTERAGYDCDYDGEYLGGTCHKCSDTHRSSTPNVVYVDDIIPADEGRALLRLEAR